jgi:hypothetical protein
MLKVETVPMSNDSWQAKGFNNSNGSFANTSSFLWRLVSAWMAATARCTMCRKCTLACVDCWTSNIKRHSCGTAQAAQPVHTAALANACYAHPPPWARTTLECEAP